MASEPYFPKPPPKSVYREAPIVPKEVEPTRKRIVVARPSDHPTLADTQPPLDRVPTYWERHTVLLRHPRPVGVGLAILGALATWSTVDTLSHGGTYGRASALFGPVAALSGLWITLFGYPIQRATGSPPQSWILGYVLSIGIGLLVGISLAIALASA